MASSKRPEETRLILGRVEFIALPQFTKKNIVKAKIDSGAFHSSIHASNVAIDPATDSVTFTLRLASSGRKITRTLPLLRTVRVKSSCGTTIYRPLIQTTIFVGQVPIEAPLLLSDRSTMAYQALIGRSTLIQGRFLIDPSRTFIVPSKQLIRMLPAITAKFSGTSQALRDMTICVNECSEQEHSTSESSD